MIFILWQLEEENKGRVMFMHYQPNHPTDGITEEQAQAGLFVEEIPEPDDIPGKAADLFVNPTTAELWYEYRDREPGMEERLEHLEQLIDVMLGEE